MSSQPKEFPRIPEDPHSEMLLNSITLLSQNMLSSGGSDRVQKLGKILLVLGTSPRQFDFIYFLIHHKSATERINLCNWYNSKVCSQGMEYRLDLLNREIGDMVDWFNPFQLVMHPIIEKAKVDHAWVPMSDIFWGIFASLFDRKKSHRFIESLESIIVNSKEDIWELERPNLN